MKIESAKQYIEMESPKKLWVYKLETSRNRDGYTTISKHVPEYCEVSIHKPRRWDYQNNRMTQETDPLKFEYYITFKGQATNHELWHRTWGPINTFAFTNRKEAWDEFNKRLKESEDQSKETNKLIKLKRKKEQLERERCTVTRSQISEKFGIPIDKLIIVGY